MLASLWFLIKFIFWLVLVAAFLTALTTHFLLWFELRLKSLRGKLSGRIPYLNLLKSFFIETACYFIHPFLLPIAFVSSKTSSSSHAESTPILFVHGYLQNKTDWLWFKRKLKKISAIGPLFAFNLLPPFCSIAYHADELKKEIERIKEKTKQNKIILVGHSMGGLISSYYSEYVAKPGEVEKVISLGSPFQGTRLTALGFGACMKEMAPRSRFLEELTRQMQNSSTPYYFVGSKIDNLIVPWDSAFPPDTPLPGKNNLVLEDHGHLRLLISSVVIKQVAEWIQGSSV